VNAYSVHTKAVTVVHVSLLTSDKKLIKLTDSVKSYVDYIHVVKVLFS